MIQGYLHSFHIGVVSILFLQNSIHGTTFFVVIKTQQKLTMVKKCKLLYSDTQLDCRGSFIGSVTWRLFGLGVGCVTVGTFIYSSVKWGWWEDLPHRAIWASTDQICVNSLVTGTDEVQYKCRLLLSASKMQKSPFWPVKKLSHSYKNSLHLLYAVLCVLTQCGKQAFKQDVVRWVLTAFFEVMITH